MEQILYKTNIGKKIQFVSQWRYMCRKLILSSKLEKLDSGNATAANIIRTDINRDVT